MFKVNWLLGPSVKVISFRASVSSSLLAKVHKFTGFTLNAVGQNNELSDFSQSGH
jgi:hypothetical protein